MTTASTAPTPQIYGLLGNDIISATWTSRSYSLLPGSDLVITLSCPVTMTVKRAGMGKQGRIGGLLPSIPPAEWLYPGVHLVKRPGVSCPRLATDKSLHNRQAMAPQGTHARVESDKYLSLALGFWHFPKSHHQTYGNCYTFKGAGLQCPCHHKW